ncbi:MAG: hypothetical protein AB7G11_10580 [Phycisphaerales bacterium]
MHSAANTVIRLEQIRVASPCTERWEDMSGDERSRHCARCNLHVHNLSAMSRAQADALVASASQGRVCVRFYQRADGTILTSDCPVGLARARAALRRTVGRVAAALGLTAVAASAGAGLESKGGMTGRLRDWRPIAAVSGWLVPKVPPMPPAVRRGSRLLMGDVCILPPAPTSAGSGRPGAAPAPKQP